MNKALKALLYHFVAIVIILLGTYPDSPTLMPLFLGLNHFMFSFYCVFGIACCMYIRNDDLSPFKTKNYQNQINFVRTYLGFSMLTVVLTFVFYGKNVCMRELLLGLFLFSLTTLKKEDIKDVLVKYSFYFALIIFCSISIILLHELSLIQKENWDVMKMEYIKDNPIYERALRLDYQWYHLFFIAVLPFDPNTEYQRYSLIFTEPSSIGYIIPALTIGIISSKRLNRVILSLVFIIAIFLANSVWLFMSLLVSTFLGLFLILFSRSLFQGIPLLILFAIFMLLFKGEVFECFALLLPSKYDQIVFWNETLGFFSSANKIGLFGCDKYIEDAIHAYGAEINIYRYGLFGGIIYVNGLVAFIIFSSFFLQKKLGLMKGRLLPFIAVVSSAFISIKSPMFILVNPIITFIACACFLQKEIPALNRQA
jgi:hypothetical protein